MRHFFNPSARSVNCLAACKCLLAAVFGSGLASLARATVIESPTQYATDFESGALDPMVPNLALTPNFTQIANPSFGGASGQYAMQFHWEEGAYNGTRSYRGAEAIANAASTSFTKEIWEGFSIYLPSGMYPKNKTATIAQLFDSGGSTTIATWAGMIEIRNQDLWIEHRGNAANPPDHSSLVKAGLKWDQWNRIVIHAVTSRIGKGQVQVWLNGTSEATPDYSVKNINFGFGDWDTTTDSLLKGTSNIGSKFGMYNWDVGNYTTGETRSFYMDSINVLLDPSIDGFSTVNAVTVPEPATGGCLLGAGLFCMGRKRNSASA